MFVDSFDCISVGLDAGLGISQPGPELNVFLALWTNLWYDRNHAA
jgi:hypothetical protein